MLKKEELIEEILELELEMFLSVATDRSYTCQQNPEGLRLHRSAQFCIWAEDTLESYLEDLNRAKAEGLNLMTIKYARMENLIPRENFNPQIKEIVDLFIHWQKEVIKTYPNLMAGGRRLVSKDDLIDQPSFETYLNGELETYSGSTLSLLHRDLLELSRAGINGAERVYEYLTEKLGYESITAADQASKVNEVY
jgi:hypothetical protein